MKIKIWCDSGANIHSRKTTVVDLEKDLGFEREEWQEMDDENKHKEITQWCYNHGLEIDWQELD